MSDYSKLTKDEIAKKLDEAKKEIEELKVKEIADKAKKKSIYEKLHSIDVSPYLKQAGERYDKKTQKKTPINYLPWANAWKLVKQVYPTANYELLEYPNYITTDGGHVEQAGTLDYRITKVGCEVGATVIIEGESYTQRLYPMNQKNEPIKNPNIAAINKAQMRALVKALAIAGLGIDVYTGEDLPENEDEKKPQRKAAPVKEPKRKNYAKPNYKTFSEKELEQYSVMYHQDGDEKSNPIWIRVSSIYTFALHGDEVAQKWIKETIKKPNTPEGQATVQFLKSNYANTLRQEIKKEDAVSKIESHQGA